MFNPVFIGIALAIFPELLKAIQETIEAVEANMSNAPGAEKEREVVEAVIQWYRTFTKAPLLFGSAFKVPDSVNKAFEDSVPYLVRLVYHGMKETPEGEVVAHVPQDS